MAVVVDYQSWASGDYNWLDKTTATSAPLQINDKLNTWVSTVNANAANTNKQITVVKSPASSTSTNFIGWGIKCSSNTTGAGDMFVRFYSSSTTALAYAISSAFTDNGTNGGYGAAAGSSISGSASFYTSGQLAEFLCSTETLNGQEFFCLGYRGASSASTYVHCVTIFKDNNGEWASCFNESSIFAGCYYMPTHTTPQRNFNVRASQDSYASNIYTRFAMCSNGTTTQLPTAGNSFTAKVWPASDKLYYLNGTSNNLFGKWSTFGSDKLLCHGYYQAPIVRYTP